MSKLTLILQQHCIVPVCVELGVCKVKVSSYIAQYQIIKIARSALHFTPWQTHSFIFHLNFSGKRPAMQQLMHKDYSYTNIHHSL